MVGELGGVLGGEGLQIRPVTLNRRSVRNQDHRQLRERLARAAAQKRLGLFVRVVSLSLLMRRFCVIPMSLARPLEQAGSNHADLRLSEFDRRCLVVGRASSVCALTHPGNRRRTLHWPGLAGGVHCVVLRTTLTRQGGCQRHSPDAFRTPPATQMAGRGCGQTALAASGDHCHHRRQDAELLLPVWKSASPHQTASVAALLVCYCAPPTKKEPRPRSDLLSTPAIDFAYRGKPQASSRPLIAS